MFNTGIFEPDPEGIPEEEAELTYRLQESMHEFERGPNGKCIVEVRRFCYEHKVIDFHNACNADSWSTLHYDDNPQNEGGSHWHGGGDCMCFENAYKANGA